MRFPLVSRIFALLLVVALVAGATEGWSCVRELASAPSAPVCSSADEPCPDAGTAADSPCCPDEGSAAGHGDHCPLCPCHAPLAGRPVRPGYAPLIAMFSSRDSRLALPEVYLPIFVPPQNRA